MWMNYIELFKKQKMAQDTKKNKKWLYVVDNKPNLKRENAARL